MRRAEHRLADEASLPRLSQARQGESQQLMQLTGTPVRPARYKQAIGTTDTLNMGVTLAMAMADARKPRG